MKTPLFLTILFFQAGLLAQESEFLSGFIGKSSGEQILLQWTINSGQTCNGTIIQRSDDTLHFLPIGEIPGVCGSSETPVPYFFTDSLPLPNKINYYRLELGGQGYSRILSIPYFEFENKGYFLFPNPARDNTAIYFENPAEKPYSLHLFDLEGKEIQVVNGKGSEILLNLSGLDTAIYLFRIIPAGKPAILGKLVVAR